MNETKRCPRCGKVKPLDAFPYDRTTPDGRHTHCKVCRAEYYRGKKYADVSLKTKRDPKYPQLHDQEWLRQRYCVEFRTVKEIAAEIGCAESTLNNALNRAKIPRLPQSIRQVIRARLDREEGGGYEHDIDILPWIVRKRYEVA